MSYEKYFMGNCQTCSATEKKAVDTLHHQATPTSEAYCMRHDNQVLKAYDNKKEQLRELIMLAKDSVKRMPSWDACGVGRN